MARCGFKAAVVLATLVMATTQPAGSRQRPGRILREGGIPKAKVGREMPIREVFVVRSGFRLAFQRISELPDCAALFEDLDLDGAVALSSTSYSLPHHDAERAICDRGAFAVTRSGQTEIRLCRNIRSLEREGVAAILIHEALHTAGLGEWPVEPEGPTSSEITRSVLRACSLGKSGPAVEEPPLAARRGRSPH